VIEATDPPHGGNHADRSETVAPRLAVFGGYAALGLTVALALTDPGVTVTERAWIGRIQITPTNA
jgi:hypothetical protein